MKMALNMEQGHNTGTLNPYNTGSKMSYKDALLQESSDTSNRLGIHSFKLLHLLNRNKDKESETASTGSDDTNRKDNTTSMTTCRMRFQITITETTPDSYMEDLSEHINKILEVININTPGVLLAPWHKTSIDQKELISSLSLESLEAVKYLYGFKAGVTKPGPQYLRIHIAFPSCYTADNIVR
jgi:PPE-repeat protein